MSPGHRWSISRCAPKKIVDKPVLTANGIADLETANGIVERGDADLVATTRAHIADPYLISKARSGREDEIRHSWRGNQGCFSRMAKGWSLTCTQNPSAGREAQLGLGTLDQVTEPRTIVVVGGGPAGMRAAETAASRGHRVVLFERDDVLGGQIRYAAELPTRGPVGRDGLRHGAHTRPVRGRHPAGHGRDRRRDRRGGPAPRRRCGAARRDESPSGSTTGWCSAAGWRASATYCAT